MGFLAPRPKIRIHCFNNTLHCGCLSICDETNFKFNMEFISKFRSFLAIMLCLAVCVNSAKKSKLKLKLDALDNLLRTQMYLVNEKLDMGTKERKLLFDKFEESIENRGKPEADYRTEEDQKGLNTFRNQIGKLSTKFERNTKDIDELTDSLIRIKRGVLGEKVARKSNTDAVIKLVEVMQKNQNETKKIQEEILNNVTINQNDISNKLEEILAIQDNLMKIVNDISGQDSVGKLEMKLDKYSFFIMYIFI